MRKVDGEYAWFLFRTSPLRGEGGEIVKWYGVNTDIEGRKRAEAELRRAYDSFADAQRLSHTGSFITDLVGDDHNWSDETYRIFDFAPGSRVTVERIRSLIHPDDLPPFDAMIERALTGADVGFSFRITTGRGAAKHIRGVAHVTAVRRGIGERLDELDLLEDGARPSVRDEERHRVGVARPDVDVVDAEPVDLRLELREGVQLRLGPPPVVPGAPVADELLEVREPRALRRVRHGFLLGPAGRRDAPPQVGGRLVRNPDAEGADRGVRRRGGRRGLPDGGGGGLGLSARGEQEQPGDQGAARVLEDHGGSSLGSAVRRVRDARSNFGASRAPSIGRWYRSRTAPRGRGKGTGDDGIPRALICSPETPSGGGGVEQLDGRAGARSYSGEAGRA